MKYIWIFLLIALVSCESKEDRFYRIANDRYLYLSSGVIHLDSKCNINYDSYIPFLKYNTKLTDLSTPIYYKNGEYRPLVFCTKCCKIDDIEKFKSQLKKEH